MTTKAVAEMSLEEWLQRNGSKFRPKGDAELKRESEATEVLHEKLQKAVAYYLYIASKDVPDDKAGLYRASALALIGKKPVDQALLRQAEKRKSDDDPLYSNDIWVKPEIETLWQYHHRVEIEAAERAYDAAHSRRSTPIQSTGETGASFNLEKAVLSGSIRPELVGGDTVFSFETGGFEGGDSSCLEITINGGSGAMNVAVDGEAMSSGAGQGRSVTIRFMGDIELGAAAGGLEYLAHSVRQALPRK